MTTRAEHFREGWAEEQVNTYRRKETPPQDGLAKLQKFFNKPVCSCSQCGQVFGPGSISYRHESYSDCKSHQTVRKSRLIIHKSEIIYGGQDIEGWIQYSCSCGWTGQKHYAHNDFQHSNAREELDRHLEEQS